jgi:hypothetical protein
MCNGGTHPQAVQKFLGPELAADRMTSVWSSGRFTTLVRCPACMQMVSLEKAKGTCRCGGALPEPPRLRLALDDKAVVFLATASPRVVVTVIVASEGKESRDGPSQ